MEFLERSSAESMQWFWEHGIKRQGKYSLPISSWLYTAAEIHSVSSRINRSRSSKRPTIGVWGPSAAGKSTLISSYVDSAADDYGKGSALHWDGGVPARFVVKNKALQDVIVINPFLYGSDASGCVSRFVLRDSVDDPLHPVQLKFADAFSIMHALALGYLSECHVADAEGQKTFLTPQIFQQKLARHGGGGASPGSDSATNFNFLYRFSDLIGTLADSDSARYSNLRSSWPVLRRQMLESSGLRSSEAVILDFAADLLWDSHPTLTALFNKLMAKRRELSSIWGDKTVQCSLEVAAIFLDIDRYKKLVRSEGAPLNGSMSKIRAIGYQENGNSVAVGVGYPRPLVNTNEDFGLLQGIVAELEIPLRRSAFAESAKPFVAFLEIADLLDFPGVAQAHENSEQTRINLNSVPEAENYRLLTEVLKRGKTASIVSSYAKSLGLDGFCILTRWGRFPAQPAQLLSGINTWWQYTSPDFHPDKGPSPLPLNLVLTFCANLVNQVVQAGADNGLQPVFDMLGKLSYLANPNVVSTIFATNYSQFPDGNFLKNGDRVEIDDPELQRAAQQIINDPDFTKNFASDVSRCSFQQMLRDGGCDYFFTHLARQAQESPLKYLLSARELQLKHNLRDLLKQASPSATATREQRQRELTAWSSELRTRFLKAEDEDKLASLSLKLRQLLDVDPQTLDPIPVELAAYHPAQITKFVESQFVKWSTSKAQGAVAQERLAALGLTDATLANRILYYISDSVSREPIAAWLRKNFGRLASSDECSQARRFLAHKMARNIILANGEKPSHPDADSIKRLLTEYSEAESSFTYDASKSPHVVAFLEPFLSRLHELAESGSVGDRPEQPGDAELQAIIQSFEASSN